MKPQSKTRLHDGWRTRTVRHLRHPEEANRIGVFNREVAKVAEGGAGLGGIALALSS